MILTDRDRNKNKERRGIVHLNSKTRQRTEWSGNAVRPSTTINLIRWRVEYALPRSTHIDLLHICWETKYSLGKPNVANKVRDPY